jgi:bacterioferritin (cytochrome b1)
MKTLAQHNCEKLIDVLCERLTFERAGVHLYDSIIAKMRAAADPQLVRMLPQMEQHRDQEKEHEEWLECCIRDLGADTLHKTPMAQLVEIESQGIERVILDGDPEIAHAFHALLAAELVDNAGWDLLVQLADQAGDREMKKAFKKRLREEAEHLVLVRKAMKMFAIHDVLGEPVELPAGP